MSPGNREIDIQVCSCDWSLKDSLRFQETDSLTIIIWETTISGIIFKGLNLLFVCFVKRFKTP